MSRPRQRLRGESLRGAKPTKPGWPALTSVPDSPSPWGRMGSQPGTFHWHVAGTSQLAPIEPLVG